MPPSRATVSAASAPSPPPRRPRAVKQRRTAIQPYSYTAIPPTDRVEEGARPSPTRPESVDDTERRGPSLRTRRHRWPAPAPKTSRHGSRSAANGSRPRLETPILPTASAPRANEATPTGRHRRPPEGGLPKRSPGRPRTPPWSRSTGRSPSARRRAGPARLGQARPKGGLRTHSLDVPTAGPGMDRRNKNDGHRSEQHRHPPPPPLRRGRRGRRFGLADAFEPNHQSRFHPRKRAVKRTAIRAGPTATLTRHKPRSSAATAPAVDRLRSRRRREQRHRRHRLPAELRVGGPPAPATSCPPREGRSSLTHGNEKQKNQE